MKTLLLLMTLAQGADMGTTLVNLNHGCRELNPLYRGNTTRIVSTKVAVSLGISGYSWLLRKKGHTRLSKIVMWTAIGAGAAAATWNASILSQCGG